MKYSKSELLKMYEIMIRGKAYDARLGLELKKGNLVSMFHFGLNQEAVDTGIVCALKPEDMLIAYHRNRGALFERLDMKKFTAGILGRHGGYNGGIGGEMKQFSMKDGCWVKLGVIGSQFISAPGYAFAMKQKKTGGVMVSVSGEGSAAMGTLHEGLNMSALFKLPIIYVIENNSIGMSTMKEEVQTWNEISSIAKLYNIRGVTIDGQDPVAVRETMEAALVRARNFEPSIIEILTYRLSGHYFGDNKHYIDPERERLYLERFPEPIANYEKTLLERNACTQAELYEICDRVSQQINEAFDWAYAQPAVTAGELLADRHVYSNTERGLLK